MEAVDSRLNLAVAALFKVGVRRRLLLEMRLVNSATTESKSDKSALQWSYVFRSSWDLQLGVVPLDGRFAAELALGTAKADAVAGARGDALGFRFQNERFSGWGLGK